MILTRKLFLVDIFLTCRFSKSIAFCEFASVDFEPRGISAIKFEAARIHFLSDVFLAVAVVFA